MEHDIDIEIIDRVGNGLDNPQTLRITTDHAASSYGVPVLVHVGCDCGPRGPGDNVPSCLCADADHLGKNTGWYVLRVLGQGLGGAPRKLTPDIDAAVRAWLAPLPGLLTGLDG